MRPLYRFLLSRRLATALIAVVIAFSALATLWPLGPSQDPDVVRWARTHSGAEAVVGPLGLHQPYTSPLFLVVVVLLIGSTTACSLERTQQSVALLRMASTSDCVPRLSRRPSFQLSAEMPLEALDVVARDLRALRMRVRPVEGGLVASRNRWGGLGSPLFHWSLVGLFVFAALGQLTRSEGRVAVVSGASVVDTRDAYLNGLQTGPFFGERFSGVTLEVGRIAMGFQAGGADRGDSPYVRAIDGSETVAQGVVYPNHPLRFGAVVVHRGELGPAAYITIRLPNGEVDQRRPVPFVGGDEAVRVASLTMTTPGVEKSESISLESVKGQKIVVGLPQQDYRSDAIGVGETASLPNGVSVTLDELSVFAQLTVVSDWSVPFIYLFFVLAVIGEFAALFFPPRLVVVASRPEQRELAVWVLRKKLDPAFPLLVERSLRMSLVSSEPEESE